MRKKRWKIEQMIEKSDEILIEEIKEMEQKP